MKELPYQRATLEIINMVNSKKTEEYNEHLFNILQIILKENILDDIKELNFYEFFELTYHCLHVILKQSEDREDYEICAFIIEIINNEDNIMKEWLNTLPEEEKEDMEEQFENLKITMKILKEQH